MRDLKTHNVVSLKKEREEKYSSIKTGNWLFADVSWSPFWCPAPPAYIHLRTIPKSHSILQANSPWPPSHYHLGQGTEPSYS
jgi:hypothetical protein